jgi:hypothetical protein
MSSIITPNPPLKCVSNDLTGGGFSISNILKKIKARKRVTTLISIKLMEIRNPVNSSITILPESFSLKDISAKCDEIVPRTAKIRIKIRSTGVEGFVSIKNRTPAAVPNVPGATGK